MTELKTKSRFRKERLESFIESARKAGARIDLDLTTGKVVIDFGAANDPKPAAAPQADEDAEARERAMRASMRGRR